MEPPRRHARGQGSGALEIIIVILDYLGNFSFSVACYCILTATERGGIKLGMVRASVQCVASMCGAQAWCHFPREAGEVDGRRQSRLLYWAGYGISREGNLRS